MKEERMAKKVKVVVSPHGPHACAARDTRGFPCAFAARMRLAGKWDCRKHARGGGDARLVVIAEGGAGGLPLATRDWKWVCPPTEAASRSRFALWFAPRRLPFACSRPQLGAPGDDGPSRRVSDAGRIAYCLSCARPCVAYRVETMTQADQRALFDSVEVVDETPRH